MGVRRSPYVQRTPRIVRSNEVQWDSGSIAVPVDILAGHVLRLEGSKEHRSISGLDADGGV